MDKNQKASEKGKMIETHKKSILNSNEKSTLKSEELKQTLINNNQ